MATQLDHLLPTLTFRLTRADWAAFERLPSELTVWEKLYVIGPPMLCGAVFGFFDDQIRAAAPVDLDSLAGKLLTGSILISISLALYALLMRARTRHRAAGTMPKNDKAE